MQKKRYYWIKLKEDFFEEDVIAYISELENGSQLLIMYLKMLLLSLKKDGKIVRIIAEEFLPYEPVKLSEVLNVNIEIINEGLHVFEKYGLITYGEKGELLLNQYKEMVGSETADARRQRKHRNLVAEQEKCDNVTPMSQDGHSEVTPMSRENNIDVTQKSHRDREKIIDKEKDNKKESEKYTMGLHSNVHLTKEEYEKFCKKYPLTHDDQIDHLSNQKLAHDYRYESDYAVLIEWGRKDNWIEREKLEAIKNADVESLMS